MGGDGGTTTAAAGLLLLLLAASTHALINTGRGVVTPGDPYGFIGHNLILTCNLTRRSVYENASSMFFTWGQNDTRVDAKYISILSPTSIQLTKPVRGSQDDGTYVCWVGLGGSKKEIVGFQKVWVDHKPEPVKNISCVVDDWMEMNCSWTLGQSYLHPEHINVSLIWVVSMFFDNYESDQQVPCPEMNTKWCVWRRGIYHPDAVYNMRVIVKNIRTKDEALSEVFRIQSGDLVKPRPVQRLAVRDANSTCVHISWQSSNQYRQFVYHLTYEALATCQGGKSPHTQAEETKWPDTKAVLCDMTPFTCYEIKVAAMPIPTRFRGRKKTAGFLSSWNSVIGRTQESVPVRAPPMHPGGFVQTFCNELPKCRTVTVYWKPVEKKYLHGKLTEYTLKYRPVGRSDSEARIERVSADSLSKELILSKDQAYRVWLFARNGVGLSNVNSTIVIPEWQGEEVKPRDIVVQAEESGNPRRFYIQWQPPTQGDVRSYAVFWCRGDRASLKCQDKINWIPLDKSQTSTEVDISATEISTDSFLFGVSAEVDMEASSVFSGIFWGTCNYVKGRVPDERPRRLRIISRLPNPGLWVEWQREDCSPTRSYVSRYLLSYCTVNNSNKCTEPPVRVNLSREETSYVIEEAEAGRRYMVQVQPWSPAGNGPENRGFHLYTVSTSSALSVKTLGVILSAVFLGIFLLVVVLLLIRKFRKMKTKFPIEFISKPGSNENINFDHMYEKVEPEPDYRRDGRYRSVDSETALIDSEVAFDRRPSKSGTKSRGPAPPRPTPPSSGSHPSGNSYIRQGYLSNVSSQPVYNVQAGTVPPRDPYKKQGYCTAMPGQPALNPQPHTQAQSYCSAMPGQHPFKMSPPIPIPKTAPATGYRRQESIPMQGGPWVLASTPSTSSTPGQTAPSAPSNLASTPLLQRSESPEDDVPQWEDMSLGDQWPTPPSLGYVQQGQLSSFHPRP